MTCTSTLAAESWSGAVLAVPSPAVDEQIIAVISKLRGSRIVHPIAVQFAKLTSEGSLISQEQKPSLLVGFVIQGTKRDSSSKHLKQLSELALSFVRALIPCILPSGYVRSEGIAIPRHRPYVQQRLLNF